MGKTGKVILAIIIGLVIGVVVAPTVTSFLPEEWFDKSESDVSTSEGTDEGSSDEGASDEGSSNEETVAVTFETFQDESLYTTRVLQSDDTVAGKWIRVPDLENSSATIGLSVSYQINGQWYSGLFGAGTYYNAGYHLMCAENMTNFTSGWETNTYTDSEGVQYFEFYIPAEGTTLTWEAGSYTGTIEIDETTTFTLSGNVLELIPDERTSELVDDVTFYELKPGDEIKGSSLRFDQSAYETYNGSFMIWFDVTVDGVTKEVYYNGHGGCLYLETSEFEELGFPSSIDNGNTYTLVAADNEQITSLVVKAVTYPENIVCPYFVDSLGLKL